MKTLRIYALICGLSLLGTLSAQAAQLATAKVMSVTGTVTKYTADGAESPLSAGDILTEGDGITTSYHSVAMLVFSNGSELTLEENTHITIRELAQKPFSSSQRYEQLQARPKPVADAADSTTGSSLATSRSSSKAPNSTLPPRTAAIRGTQFSAYLRYNVYTGDMILKINNLDGLVDAITRFAGVEYNEGKTGERITTPN